jgi:predicted secreted protein
MTPYETLITFVIIWWVVLFMVLPFGAEPPEQPEKGHADSAPARPRMLVKMAVTTLLAAVLTALAYGIAQTGWISFRA